MRISSYAYTNSRYTKLKVNPESIFERKKSTIEIYTGYVYTVLTLCERTNNRNSVGLWIKSTEHFSEMFAMATNLMKEFHKCLQAENTTEVSVC